MSGKVSVIPADRLIDAVDELREGLAQRERELEEREVAVAAAQERLSQDAMVQAAYAAGEKVFRDRVIALIDLQLEQLGGAGLNAISLKTLRRMIAGDEGGSV